MHRKGTQEACDQGLSQVADEEDHEQRLSMVTRDLGKSIRYPSSKAARFFASITNSYTFSHSDPIQKHHDKTRTMRVETFQRDCKGFATVAPPTLSAYKKPKPPSGDDLLEYVRSLEKAQEEALISAAPYQTPVEHGRTTKSTGRPKSEFQPHSCWASEVHLDPTSTIAHHSRLSIAPLTGSPSKSLECSPRHPFPCRTRVEQSFGSDSKIITSSCLRLWPRYNEHAGVREGSKGR